MSISTDLEPRTYFSRFENALADFGPHLDAIPTILNTVRELHFTHVYIPESRAYIALETDDGGEPIAYVMPHVIALHPRDGVSAFVELPQPVAEIPEDADDAAVAAEDDVATASSPAKPAPQAKASAKAKAAKPAKAEEPEPALCDGCFTNLPATGRCDYCD